MATEQPPPPPIAAIEELAAGGPVALPELRAPIPGRARGDTIRRAIAYGGLILVSVLFFVPFFWTISTSLKPLSETEHTNLLPHVWTIKGYHDALTTFNFARYAANSFGLSVAATLSSVFLASLGGYAFARLRFPGREALFLLVLGTLMIPDQLRLVPVYVMLTHFPLFHWNLIDTYQGYWLLKIVSATALFLMRQYFLTIPRDLEEAAKLDGAGYFKTFWKVMLPLAGPALAAIAILEFQGAWNDFFWANLVLQTSPHYTLPVGMAQFIFEHKVFWNDLMAATVIAIVPIAVIYVFFQRYFVAGITSSGVKG